MSEDIDTSGIDIEELIKNLEKGKEKKNAQRFLKVTKRYKINNVEYEHEVIFLCTDE